MLRSIKVVFALLWENLFAFTGHCFQQDFFLCQIASSEKSGCSDTWFRLERREEGDIAAVRDRTVSKLRSQEQYKTIPVQWFPSFFNDMT